MDDCIFCKIARGEIPSYKIYEDENFVAFLDLAPLTKGHALLIPKEHYANLFELPEAVGAKIMPLAKKIAAHMKERLCASGFQLLQNNGETGGQTIFHYHLHLIPRFDDDRATIYKHAQLNSEELERLRDCIQF